MIVLNYSHPLTEHQIARISEIVGEMPLIQVIESQIDRERPLAEIAVELADAANLSPEQWQMTPIILNPPALAPLAVALIAEIHGRAGGFPAMLNIRPIADSIPTRYEVAELLNLQAIRETARRRRQ